MRRIGLLLGVIGCLGIGAGIASQTVPDFSGRWTTEPQTARGDMGSGWGSTITIAQSAAQLAVEYAFFGRGDMQAPLKFVYALDGSETRNAVMMGRGVEVEVSRTAWDGQTLAITTVYTFADPASGKPVTTEVKRRLTLESPTSLVVEVTREGVLGGRASTTRTLYRKN